MLAVNGPVPGRGERDAQPGVEKCHGLTNMLHLNPEFRDGEDHAWPMETSASHRNGSLQTGKVSPSLINTARRGGDIPASRSGSMLEETTAARVAGTTDKCMTPFKGWQVKHLQAWEQPEKRGRGNAPRKYRPYASSAID